jgi:acyl-coenzyme A thioesterase PaaI-like protein
MSDLSHMVPPTPVEMGGEEGWTLVEMPFSSTGGSSFVDGDPDGHRLRVRMYFRPDDKRLVTRVWFGPQAEGPPGHAHGGSMAAVLDHCMGIASWASGVPVVAASITIGFHRKLPLGRVVTAETWVNDIAERKVFTMGYLYLDDPEKPFATGEGLFIRQEIEAFSSFFEQGAAAQAKAEDLKSRMQG